MAFHQANCQREARNILRSGRFNTMAVERRNIMPPVVPNGSSGDGSSSPSAVDPTTGQANPSYQAPQPSASLSAADTDANNGSQRGASLVQPYTNARDQYSAAAGNPGDGAGLSVGNVPDNFRAAPGPGSADNAPAMALGPRDPLTLRGDGSDPATGNGGGQAIL